MTMTASSFRGLLLWARDILSPGSESAFLDALILMEWACGVPRDRLLAEMGTPATEVISPDALTRFSAAIEERREGRPVAYITGMREFWGLPIASGPGALVPRPETEILVETALELVSSRTEKIRFLDCCTGTGCVGIAVILELSRRGQAVQGHLSDISAEALAWAQRNASALLPADADLAIHHTEWLHGIPTVDLITANPPYLSVLESEHALALGWGEPMIALAAGADGLDGYRQIVPQAMDHLSADGYLVMECGFQQAAAIGQLCEENGFVSVAVRQDLSGNDRVVHARRGRDT